MVILAEVVVVVTVVLVTFCCFIQRQLCQRWLSELWDCFGIVLHRQRGATKGKGLMCTFDSC